MKTAEEILNQYESFHYDMDGLDETHYYKDNVLLAMEEYRSQLTESKELPNDDAVHDNAERRADLNFDEEIGYILGAKWMRSIASPLLASKDARIRELEEELERLVSIIENGIDAEEDKFLGDCGS